MSSYRTHASRRRALTQLGLAPLSLTLLVSGVSQSAHSATPDAADEARLDVNPWTRARTQLVLNPRLAYFDTAGFGPSSRAVLAAQYRAQELLHTDPQAFYESRYSNAAVLELPQRLARWLDASVDELCFTRGGAAGLMQCAQALSLQAGDEVLLTAQLPTALQRFWNQQARQRGLIVTTINLPVPLTGPAEVIAAVENAIGERSKVLVCSHVQAGDGALLPIRELCQLARSRGLVSMIDGSLSLGALQFSMRQLECDVYGASLSHWLNGPQDTGVLFVRSSLQAQLQPEETPGAETLGVDSITAWPALLQRWPMDFIEQAPQFQSLSVALNWHEIVGRGLLEARLRELHAYTRLRLQALNGLQLLTPSQPGMWLALLSLRPMKRSARELSDWLRRNDKVVVGEFDTSPGELDALRISLHIYNSHDEIERLLQGLQRALRT